MSNETLLPYLIVATVALLLWGIYQIVGGVADQRKRIRQRLSGVSANTSAASFDPESFTVVKRKIEFKGASGMLALLPGMKTLGIRLSQVWPSISLARFALITLACALGSFVAILVSSGSPLPSSIAAAICGMIPFILMTGKRNRTEKQMMDQLPEALEFLARVLRSGHSLSTGIQMMAEELPKPLCTEFGKCYDAHSLGQPLEDALKDSAIRIDNPDFGFFVTATLIQRQTGGDLAEVLDNISEMIRQRIRLSSHVKAKTAEGRMTGHILCAFPVLMFMVSYYLNPKYAEVLLHTNTGIGLLLLAAFMLVAGSYAIRRITTIVV